MLKMTGVKIEYITDLEMYTFIEENLRGGVTTINHRYFKANNEYLDDYDNSEPTSSLHYVDANNLYGKGTDSHFLDLNYYTHSYTIIIFIKMICDTLRI